MDAFEMFFTTPIRCCSFPCANAKDANNPTTIKIANCFFIRVLLFYSVFHGFRFLLRLGWAVEEFLLLLFFLSLFRGFWIHALHVLLFFRRELGKVANEVDQLPAGFIVVSTLAQAGIPLRRMPFTIV